MAIIWNKIIPRWGGLTIEPPEAKKDTGYIAGDKPPAKWENWLRKGIYEALDETRDVIESIDSQLAQDALDLSNHISNLTTDTDGVHGFKAETGDWTPTLLGATVAGSNTYTIRTGRYKRLGDRVFLDCYIALLSKDVNMAGALQIGGLPFAVKSIPNIRYAASVGFTQGTITDTSRPIIGAQLVAGVSNILLTKHGRGIDATALLPSDITNNFQFVISISYEI